MAIQFRCPQGHLLSIDEQYAGKRLRCPRCLKIADIPMLAVNGSAEPSRKTSSGSLGAEKIKATVIAEKPAATSPKPVANSTTRPAEPAKPTLTKAAPPTVTAPAPPPIMAPTPLAGPPPPLPTPSAPPIAPPPLTAPVGPPVEVFSEFAGHEDNASIPLDFNPTVLDALSVVGYQAEPQRVKRVYQLAIGVALLALVHLAPAARHLAITSAPDWARAIILVALLEVAFAVWMALMPDWSTVWTTMLVLAMVATLYGAALAIAILTPLGKSAILEMDDIREPARAWCTMVVVLTCAMTYACGRYSFKWHKQYQLGR